MNRGFYRQAWWGRMAVQFKSGGCVHHVDDSLEMNRRAIVTDWDRLHSLIGKRRFSVPKEWQKIMWLAWSIERFSFIFFSFAVHLSHNLLGYWATLLVHCYYYFPNSRILVSKLSSAAMATVPAHSHMLHFFRTCRYANNCLFFVRFVSIWHIVFCARCTYTLTIP